ncbi:MAG: HD domain-containing protein [bacterium]|nr:MAG: HD domain-containing protein [bacterium]
MVKTSFKRLEIDNPDVAVFSVSGKLGFHQNLKVQRLTGECRKRDFKTVIFDFSELTSLGGGVARILRDFVKSYGEQDHNVYFVVTNEIVLQFLQDEGQTVHTYSTLDEALRDVGVSTRAEQMKGEAAPEDEVPAAEDSDGQMQGEAAPEDEVPAAEDSDEQVQGSCGSDFVRSGSSPGDSTPGKDDTPPEDEFDVEVDTSGIILMSYDGNHVAGAQEKGKGKEKGGGKETARKTDKTGVLEAKDVPAGEDGTGGNIFEEIYGENNTPSPPDWLDKPSSPFNEKLVKSIPVDDVDKLNKQLKRRILELKTLFSISTDFNSIRDRKKLLDIFLLTSIAQGGVESAAFFEKKGDTCELVMAKGLEIDGMEPLTISMDGDETTGEASKVIPLDSFRMNDDERQKLQERGLEFICPFMQSTGIAGMVLLGRRIAGRGMKEQDFEFLRILISVAQGAYENANLFEHEHERTLGIVKTLISLIEDNTLIKGTSEFVSRYVGLVAKNLDYPDEYFKDLIYGTVLRDIGMIKISDLILRSPRDLSKEEWEIIKKHPEDGAEMLQRMKFKDHVIEIVRSHHERFNGEGYPCALRGRDIPLGARIISVVESYAAMTHERPNRPVLSEREALDTLKENYGVRYDREVVSQFSKIIEREIASSVQHDVKISQ